MRTPKTIFILALLVIGRKVSAQDYFIKNSDTTLCSNLSCIAGAQGEIKKISYTDSNGQEVVIKGKENLQDITTVHYLGVTLDKTPLNLSKPDGYTRFELRAVDGKIIVYQDMATDGAGKDRFFLKMPDGTFVDINPKTIESEIKPYLEQCPEFVKQYKGDFSKKEEPFMQMIKLYNSSCN